MSSVASLCCAIKNGNVDEVKAQLNAGADPNGQTSDWHKTRPLILAAASGRRDIIQALLSCTQLDLNLPDGLFGNTALMDASHTGNTDVVKLLAEDKRINVDFRTERSGMTALMQAARYGHTKVVEILVRASPGGVNLQSGGGCTPLMLVCLAPNQAVLNDGEIVKSMLSVPEIDLNIKDNQGKTALDWARDKELFMIEKLILERANANLPTAESLPTEIQVRELQEKLKKSEEANRSLRLSIEELTLRVKEQDLKIHSLKTRN